MRRDEPPTSAGRVVPAPGFPPPALGGNLSVVLVIGLVGGVAMASVAGARRTQSSYPRFLAGTDPSDLTVTLSIQTAGTDDAGNATDLAPRIGLYAVPNPRSPSYPWPSWW